MNFSGYQSCALIFSLFAISTNLIAPFTHAETIKAPAPTYQRCYQERVTMTSSAAEIPNPIRKPKLVIPLGCDRPFVYRGEIYSADSPQAQDASTLRDFVKSVPEADELLDDYQSNRRLSKISAYTGTLGLVVTALAFILPNQFNGDDRRRSMKAALLWTGLGLTAGGFVYSFAILRSNESLIPKAVEKYNEARPNDPIELQFSAGWRF